MKVPMSDVAFTLHCSTANVWTACLSANTSLAFNGFFNIFGFLFQLFSGTGEEAVISRILQWPWWVITQVTLGVMTVVVIALVFTTRRALRADLAVVLKGE